MRAPRRGYPPSDLRSALARRLLLKKLWSKTQIGARTQREKREDLERAGLRLTKDFSLTEWGTTGASARSTSARLAVAFMAS